MENDFMELDALWDEVKQPKKKPITEEISKKNVFIGEENWVRGKGVAIIHASTQTILGSFVEYTHLHIAECRKLVRSNDPICITDIEEVDGNWWIDPLQHKPEPVQVWHERKQAMIHVYLDALGVHAPGVFLNVFLSYGSIARVELAENTRFAQMPGICSTLLDLPAGTNILEVMAKENKIKLKEELGI